MNMAMNRLTMAGLLAGLALAAGCDDDKDKQPTGLATGVDGSKPLGTVTPDEAQQICMSSETWARAQLADARQKELTCRLTAVLAASGGSLAGGGLPGAGGMGAAPAVTDAQLRMTCKTTLDQCLAAPAPTQMAAGMCQRFPASCTATVAEYEACLNDVPPFVDMTVAMLPTCETVNGLSFLSLLPLINGLPATCKTFQMKCGMLGIPGVPGLTPPGGLAQP